MKKISYINDFQTWEAAFSFYTPIQVRFSETDMFGHVNNVAIFIYFEQARIEFLRHLGVFTNIITSETVPIAADLQCDYLKQIYFPQELKVYVKIQEIGSTSIELHYLGKNEQNEACFTGRGRLVNVHVKTGKPTPFTAEERLLLAQKEHY